MRKVENIKNNSFELRVSGDTPALLSGCRGSNELKAVRDAKRFGCLFCFTLSGMTGPAICESSTALAIYKSVTSLFMRPIVFRVKNLDIEFHRRNPAWLGTP